MCIFRELSIDEENIRNIGHYLNTKDIDIRYGDFEDACSDVHSGDFIYLDSPYIPLTETANFTDYTKEGFTLDDHKRLAAFYGRMSEKGVKVMLSNNDTPLVYELYDQYTIEQVDVRRSINRNASRRSGKEVVITNY